MSKERKGYVFEDKNGKWFARVTFIDETGKRRNVKRTATTKPEAKDILKRIVRELGVFSSEMYPFTEFSKKPKKFSIFD